LTNIKHWYFHQQISQLTQIYSPCYPPCSRPSDLGDRGEQVGAPGMRERRQALRLAQMLNVEDISWRTWQSPT
jgi:hypothetical protein